MDMEHEMLASEAVISKEHLYPASTDVLDSVYHIA